MITVREIRVEFPNKGNDEINFEEVEKILRRVRDLKKSRTRIKNSTLTMYEYIDEMKIFEIRNVLKTKFKYVNFSVKDKDNYVTFEIL